MPAFGKAWWELPEGRFVYWRGRITTLELIGDDYVGQTRYVSPSYVRRGTAMLVETTQHADLQHF